MTSNSPLKPYKNVLPGLQRVSKARVRLGPPSYGRRPNYPIQGQWRFLPPSLVAQVGLLHQRLHQLSCPSYQGHKAQFTTSSPRRVSASPPRRKAERPPRDSASPHDREAKLSFREPRGEYSPSPPRHRMHGYSSRTQTTQLEESSHSDSNHTTSYKPRRTTRFTDGPRLKQLDALAKDIERFDPEKQDHNVEDYL